MQIKNSDRFYKNYSKASLPLQGLAEGAIHDFVNRQRSEPKTFLHHYDQLVNLPGPVREIEISGGHRILALYSEGCLLLLDMGGHEIVGEYDINKLRNDLQKNKQAPPQFWPENRSKFLIPTSPDIPYKKYSDEISPEWLYYLEDEQYYVYDQIATAILNGKRQPHFIIGGPGTGKTCILLKLLRLFSEDNYQVGIIISNNLRAYIETSLSNITQYCVNLYTYPSLDILLVDDPENIREILKSTDYHQLNTIIAAFDPLQLPYEFTDRKLKMVSSDFNVDQHVLNICYRQKEEIGKTTKHFIETIEDSTPFLKTEKIDKDQQSRAQLSRLSNDMTFVNPYGYTHPYLEYTAINLKTEVNRILENEWLMWKHWPGLLILLDGYDLSNEDYSALEPLLHRKYVMILSAVQIEDIKGLEFQHVFIFVDKTIYEELINGFKGVGKKEYHRRRMYRIPFSRAKDSLVVFAVESNKVHTHNTAS